MGKLAPFEPVLSGKALAFMLALSKRQQRQLSDLLFNLADYPTSRAIMNRKTIQGGVFSICALLTS